ncbi:MAG: hypothetical protein E5X61_40340, partial [Mesorhizobium sp.]
MGGKLPRPGRLTVWFEEIGRGDVGRVGGKNASLGEMVQALAPRGIRVPPGFATTAEAYWDFMQANQLKERIQDLLGDLVAGKAALAETGQAIRELFLHGDWPEETAAAITT